jgi:hypothetical protein
MSSVSIFIDNNFFHLKINNKIQNRILFYYNVVNRDDDEQKEEKKICFKG